MPSSDKNSGTDPRLKTRYRLIDIAAKHIASKGIEGMSLRKVADEAGITPAAVYRHFPNGKSELYEATLAMVAEEMLLLIEGNEGSTTQLIDLLVFQCDQLWQFFALHPNIAAMVVRENINGGMDGKSASPYLEQHMQHISVLRDMLADGIKKQIIKPLNISAFIFGTSSYITNFHGCRALRDVTWTDVDLKKANEDFLEHIRSQLQPL